MARASTAAGAGRGRVGLTGEPVEWLLCARKRKVSGEALLTTGRRVGRAHGRREGGGDEVR
jgi:hypothetical protein